MLRTTTTAAVRAFKPVQFSVVARRNYTDKFKEKETAEEAKYIRTKEAEREKALKEKALKEKLAKEEAEKKAGTK
ncbi:hypothetical protein BGZ80_001930 [Entomortierella chlamydospora]|uniref:Uncharacterized protein n=1 Tax=Entomortierella chlamydospora TaxID=101097 RepID=A0A9P6T390_9FUNG|nr:hypothetical protein BGZ79_004994 [Entomortierella chlamydospora]KAG0021671.1 hypothetical protein BGZ80_001930 [Entomortierella chlamydospora]